MKKKKTIGWLIVMPSVYDGDGVKVVRQMLTPKFYYTGGIADYFPYTTNRKEAKVFSTRKEAEDRFLLRIKTTQRARRSTVRVCKLTRKVAA